MAKTSKGGFKGSNKQSSNNAGGEKTPKFGNGGKFQKTAGKGSGKK